MYCRTTSTFCTLVATEPTQHVRAAFCGFNEKKFRLCVFIISCTGFFYQDKSVWSHLNNQDWSVLMLSRLNSLSSTVLPPLSANRAHYYCYLGRKQVGESCSMFRHVSVLSDCFRNVSSTSFHRTTFHSIESNSPFPHFLKEDVGKEKTFLFTYIHSLSIVVRFNLLRCFLSKQPVVILKTLALVHVITIKFHLPRLPLQRFLSIFF